jgi:GST-like protein
MIDYYTAKTLGGNARKITIMLAETGLEHDVYFVDLSKGEQGEPWYLAVNPNGKIPAIVDRDVAGSPAIFESGAILVHLAEKTGRFLPTSGPGRPRVLQWLFWQVGGVGPMVGQWSYFAVTAPQKLPFAIERYRDETARLLRVMDTGLVGNEFIAGDYSIADMALYSWIKPSFEHMRGVRDPEWVADLTNIPRWLASMAARPAVAIAMTKYEGTARRIARDVEAPL